MTDKLRIRHTAEVFTKNSADNKLSSFLMSRLSGMLGNHETSPAAEGTLTPAHADARHCLRERSCLFPHRGDASCDLRSGHCICAELCAGLVGHHLLSPISRCSQKLICRQRAPQYPPTNRVELHPQLRNNLHPTVRDLGPIRLRKASTLTRLIGPRTASWPQWDFLMMRCRCLLLLRVCREPVSCWQFPPWLPAACFPSLRRSTAASAPLSTDCARLWWPTCCWRF